jgi:LCP family protein required for cell wall assembly
VSVSNREANKDGNTVGGGKIRTSPRKAFAKFFVVTFLCCVVGITAGLGALDSFLGQKPMDQSEALGTEIIESAGQTAEKLNVLIPAEGIFKTDIDFKDSKRVNILLFGNTLNNSKQKGLTDTIMLGSFDPEAKKFDIISVPRDTYYEREGYANSAFLKINSVMETDGIKGACESVHDVLQGIPINYYAVVDYNGIAKIIDSIGGVPMDIPFNMYYTDRKQGLYIDLKKGQQTLDGVHAIQFLRYRKGYTDGDIGRVDAQQRFVKAAIKESLGLNLPNVAQTVVDNVDSDIDVRAMVYLATNASSLTSDTVSSHMLPGSDGHISGSKLSFWIPAESDEVVDMLREIYTGVKATTGGAITTPSATSGSSVGADRGKSSGVGASQ